MVARRARALRRLMGCPAHLSMHGKRRQTMVSSHHAPHLSCTTPAASHDPTTATSSPFHPFSFPFFPSDWDTDASKQVLLVMLCQMCIA